MSDSTGSRPRRTAAGQPPAWFRPQDPPLPAARRPDPQAADLAWAPRPTDVLPQAWPARPGPGPSPAAYAGGPGPRAGDDPPVDPAVPVQRNDAERAPGGDSGHPAPPRWWARVFGGEDEADETGLVDDWAAMLQVIDAPVDQHRITVSALGPGAGRTTAALGLGTALALHRRDPVTSLDLDPHGRLAERVGAEHARTVRDLLAHLARIHTASDLRRFTSVAHSRLEVLAAARGGAPTGAELAAALQVLLTFRPVVVVDTGADPTLPATAELMRTTDSLVVPTITTEVGLRSAVETIAWWEQRAPLGPRLIAGAVVPVVRAPFVPDPARPPRGRELRRLTDEHEAACDALEDELLRRLGTRVRALVPVPRDPALEAAGTFVWDDLETETQDAWINVAFEVAKGFAG